MAARDSDIAYRGYWIYYDPPPIPLRQFDWAWVHDGYDGPGDPRHGNAASLEAAKQAIDEQIEELSEWTE